MMKAFVLAVTVLSANAYNISLNADMSTVNLRISPQSIESIAISTGADEQDTSTCISMCIVQYIWLNQAYARESRRIYDDVRNGHGVDALTSSRDMALMCRLYSENQRCLNLRCAGWRSMRVAQDLLNLGRLCERLETEMNKDLSIHKCMKKYADDYRYSHTMCMTADDTTSPVTLTLARDETANLTFHQLVVASVDNLCGRFNCIRASLVWKVQNLPADCGMKTAERAVDILMSYAQTFKLMNLLDFIDFPHGTCDQLTKCKAIIYSVQNSSIFFDDNETANEQQKVYDEWCEQKGMKTHDDVKWIDENNSTVGLAENSGKKFGRLMNLWHAQQLALTAAASPINSPLTCFIVLILILIFHEI